MRDFEVGFARTMAGRYRWQLTREHNAMLRARQREAEQRELEEKIQLEVDQKIEEGLGDEKQGDEKQGDEKQGDAKQGNEHGMEESGMNLEEQLIEASHIDDWHDQDARNEMVEDERDSAMNQRHAALNQRDSKRDDQDLDTKLDPHELLEDDNELTFEDLGDVDSQVYHNLKTIIANGFRTFVKEYIKSYYKDGKYQVPTYGLWTLKHRQAGQSKGWEAERDGERGKIGEIESKEAEAREAEMGITVYTFYGKKKTHRPMDYASYIRRGLIPCGPYIHEKWACAMELQLAIFLVHSVNNGHNLESTCKALAASWRPALLINASKFEESYRTMYRHAGFCTRIARSIMVAAARLDFMDNSDIFEAAIKEAKVQQELKAQQELKVQMELKAHQEIKAEAKAEAKTEAQPEAKVEAQPEAEAEAKAEAQPEVKVEVQPEAKAEVQPEAKAEAQPEVKAEARLEATVEVLPEVKAETASETHIHDPSYIDHSVGVRCPALKCWACFGNTRGSRTTRLAYDGCFNSVGKCKEDTRTDRSTIKGIMTDETKMFSSEVNDGNFNCGNANYKASLRQSDGGWNRTGVVGLVCSHGICGQLIDLKKGEKYHLLPQLLEHYLNNNKWCHKVVLGYDIACLFERWVNNEAGRGEDYSKLQELFKSVRFAGGAFHMTTHKWDCFKKYHPAFLKDVGLADFEDCERFWSQLQVMHVYMYMCIYMDIYMCVNVYLYMYVYVYVYVYVCVCKHTHTHNYIFNNTHTPTHKAKIHLTCTRMRICMCIHTHTHMQTTAHMRNMYVYMNMCMCGVYIFIYMYTYVCIHM